MLSTAVLSVKFKLHKYDEIVALLLPFRFYKLLVDQRLIRK